MNNYQLLAELSEATIDEADELPYIRQSVFVRLEPPKQNVIILKGARGIGKSTVIKQFLAAKRSQKSKVFYLSADSIFLDCSLAEFALEYNKHGGEYLAIDEIHRYRQEWQQELKTIIDSFSRLKIIVSGSSSLKLDYAISDLSRRHVMVHSKGLSFREYLNKNYAFNFEAVSLQDLLVNAADICRNITKQILIQNLDLLDIFRKYLQEGYFLSIENYASLTIYFESLINTMYSIIDSDLSYVHNDIDQIAREKIKAILRHISAKSPFTPNIAELSRNISIVNDNVLKKYLFYLDEGEILINLYPENSSYKDFQRPQKILLNNTNFSYAFSRNPDIGSLRETFVANCLKGLGTLTAPDSGDFCLNGAITFEVGGKNKKHKQIKAKTNAYVIADNLMWVEDHKLPLWLLGFIW